MVVKQVRADYSVAAKGNHFFERLLNCLALKAKRDSYSRPCFRLRDMQVTIPNIGKLHVGNISQPLAGDQSQQHCALKVKRPRFCLLVDIEKAQ